MIYYRDLKNSMDTAFDEGVIEGEVKGKIETAIKMKKKGYAIADVVEITGLSIERKTGEVY